MILFRFNLGLALGSVTGDALSGEAAESDGSRIPDAKMEGTTRRNDVRDKTLLNNWMVPVMTSTMTQSHRTQSPRPYSQNWYIGNHMLLKQSGQQRMRGKSRSVD